MAYLMKQFEDENKIQTEASRTFVNIKFVPNENDWKYLCSWGSESLLQRQNESTVEGALRSGRSEEPFMPLLEKFECFGGDTTFLIPSVHEENQSKENEETRKLEQMKLDELQIKKRGEPKIERNSIFIRCDYNDASGISTGLEMSSNEIINLHKIFKEKDKKNFDKENHCIISEKMRLEPLVEEMHENSCKLTSNERNDKPKETNDLRSANCYRKKTWIWPERIENEIEYEKDADTLDSEALWRIRREMAHKVWTNNLRKESEEITEREGHKELNIYNKNGQKQETIYPGEIKTEYALNMKTETDFEEATEIEEEDDINSSIAEGLMRWSVGEDRTRKFARDIARKVKEEWSRKDYEAAYTLQGMEDEGANLKEEGKEEIKNEKERCKKKIDGNEKVTEIKHINSKMSEKELGMNRNPYLINCKKEDLTQELNDTSNNLGADEMHLYSSHYLQMLQQSSSLTKLHHSTCGGESEGSSKENHLLRMAIQPTSYHRELIEYDERPERNRNNELTFCDIDHVKYEEMKKRKEDGKESNEYEREKRDVIPKRMQDINLYQLNEFYERPSDDSNNLANSTGIQFDDTFHSNIYCIPFCSSYLPPQNLQYSFQNSIPFLPISHIRSSIPSQNFSLLSSSFSESFFPSPFPSSTSSSAEEPSLVLLSSPLKIETTTSEFRPNVELPLQTGKEKEKRTTTETSGALFATPPIRYPSPAVPNTGTSILVLPAQRNPLLALPQIQNKKLQLS
ncbi:uncharacterized protein MONOS_5632 [Monocercomonoides exilis]|uniref:uncharacterized protein n=1 Tax=Monocercomonoides exilis TaxID=2049356 RepID=UPI00355A29DC|nr:hypothetical protein MONOS_5632 [Monocercomonoides exilis]|eukprot:MONOS_5632.1-p1 / transcript=MONOS_5632.1 / gene=MONOS_5632 / organism=Monocercomonoides_exilis_PA203 / gene_product=unspecified product / transcript_product=unspecified product / location=Mono_scaffold00166:43308-45536(-) / protein_length=743 / sequence_SO=supercontig / SO=protein_coding / is_pseudo=false